MRIVKEENIRRFFENEIYEAYFNRLQDDCQVVNELVLQYLINILLKYLDIARFRENFTVTPVTDLVTISNEINFQELQSLADYCLFSVGFFPFSFSPRNTPRENFINAGQSAYLLISKKHDQQTSIFNPLANDFVFYANLITDIRYKEMGDHDILQLIQLWEETGNKLAREHLIKKGLIIQNKRRGH